MKKIVLILLSTLALVALLGVWYVWGPADTPGGQEPLLSLTTENLEQFREAFNAASHQSRMVALLSPT